MFQRYLTESMKKSPIRESQNRLTEDNSLVIPVRFSQRIDAHMLGNMLDIDKYPLIMAIIGKPGMGKTYQLRKYLKAVGIEIFSVSAADLESDRAGEPARLLQRRYLEASASISEGKPSVLLIDDVDTTLGEWEDHTGTVNHQDILAFLMHVADDPYQIDNVGKVNRVPIFFTGNNFALLYKPLVRSGRAIRFGWEPTREEKIEIVRSIFSFADARDAVRLVDAWPTKEISFFSELLAEQSIARLAAVARDVVFPYILTDKSYKDKLYYQYCEEKRRIDWKTVMAKRRAAEAGGDCD